MADNVQLSEKERSDLLAELIDDYRERVTRAEKMVKQSLILIEALKQADLSTPDEIPEQKLLSDAQEKLKALEAYQEHLKSKK